MDKSQRPLPLVDPVGAPFWEALHRGQLLVQWCKACQRGIHYPRIHCPRCLGRELEWRESIGRGVLHAFTIVHRHFDPFFQARVPYIVGLVELEEGVRLMSSLVGIKASPDAVQIGTKLQVEFERVDESFTLHAFRPLATA